MEMFYLTMHSTHFIYGYMAEDIWYRITQIAKELVVTDHLLSCSQSIAGVIAN